MVVEQEPQAPNWDELTQPEGEIVVPPIPPNTPPETPPGTPPAPPPPTPPAPPVPPVEVKYNPVWNAMKTKIEGFEIPKEVLEGKLPEGKTEEDLILESMLANAGPDVGDDDFLAEYITKKSDPNFNREEHINSYVQRNQLAKLPNEDLIRTVYKTSHGKTDERPDGYTDEQIDEYIKGLNPIQRDQMASQIRGQLQEQQRQANEQRVAKQRADFEAEVMRTSKQFENETDFFGIKVEPDKAKEFNTRFPNYFKPQADGLTPFQKLMNDDALVYKMLYLLDQEGAVLKTLESNAKEGTKESIEIKLGLTDRLPGGGGVGSEHSTKPNWDDVTVPETPQK